MSIAYCERCHLNIDTNHDTDHFIYSYEGEIVDCLSAMEYREEQAADDIAERKEREGVLP